MAARLVRAPEVDRLVLVFDHAMVDERSLLLVRRRTRHSRGGDRRRGRPLRGGGAGPDRVRGGRHR
ncbi:hypothetical protein G5V59_10395 [Nocardioides sp. W3-2-3]|uniref:hypothetical protein n=1 Tax=Nocardioides convexus TaxID=2712224 RepID=UPI00241887B6|nr:hypothetical protein [Nocardioides convexus]NHA00366.1 hypothetical protein [Nocardioides convexus]